MGIKNKFPLVGRKSKDESSNAQVFITGKNNSLKVPQTPVIKSKSSLPDNLVALAIAVVIIVGIGVIVRLDRKSTPPTKNVVTNVCTTEANKPTLIQAAGAIYTGNPTQLAQAVVSLKQIPGYQQDPNCLYAVVSYYISVDDSKNAKQYFSDLKQVYNSKQGFSPLFVRPETITEIQSSISNISKIEKQQQSNSSALSPTPSVNKQ